VIGLTARRSEEAADQVGAAASGHGGSPAPPRRRRSEAEKLRALLVGSVIAIALVVLLLVGLGAHSPVGSSSGPVVAVGDRAPDFTLPSLTGGPPVRLDALGRDRHRPVVLNFFASWCTPCRTETPLLARTAAAEQAKGAPLQFVGVDVADKPADALPFVEASGIAYPVGTDADFRVSATVYGLNGEPNTFFIDSSGRVVGHVIGAVTPVQLDRWIRRLTGSDR
jgi:cytochrome c biogenesis protein CcmG, thiol:disulfide interchange protein DsbE